MGWIIATYYLAGNLQALFKRHIKLSPSVLGQWQSKKEAAAMDQMFDNKKITWRSTAHFYNGKRGRKDNDSFSSSWVRHVVLFNIHLFQLFECLYKTAYLTLNIFIVSLYTYKIIERQQCNPCALFIHFCLNEPFPDIKTMHACAQHKPRDTWPDQTRVSLSLSLTSGDGKKRYPRDKVVWMVCLYKAFAVSRVFSCVDPIDTFLWGVNHWSNAQGWGEGGLGFDWYIIMLCWIICSWLLY